LLLTIPGVIGTDSALIEESGRLLVPSREVGEEKFVKADLTWTIGDA
jgi:hypothetical protein